MSRGMFSQGFPPEVVSMKVVVDSWPIVETGILSSSSSTSRSSASLIKDREGWEEELLLSLKLSDPSDEEDSES